MASGFPGVFPGEKAFLGLSDREGKGRTRWGSTIF